MFQGEQESEDDEGLAQYYQDSYFSDYAEDQLTGSRNAIYCHVLDLIESETGVGKVLDVGCGCGFFLKEAKNRGWDITGIDPSEESIDYSERLLGTTFTHKGTLKDLSQENKFDVVTMIDAIGLSSEPWADLEKARTILKEGGLLHLRFSNGIFHSALFKLFIEFKMAYLTKHFLVCHRYSLTPRFIRRLLSDYGFSMVVIQNASFSEGGFINRLLRKAVGITVNSLYFISGGRILAGPSLEVIARKKQVNPS
jgi:2-polyprenyl-3-methyl-5-hydroxy-6-metoxy-1,4-benzoquinol methylase